MPAGQQQAVQLVVEVPAALCNNLVHVLHVAAVVAHDDVLERRQNVPVVSTPDNGARQHLQLDSRELVKVLL